jgi:nucleoside 2-deoxyribosyltransferase
MMAAEELGVTASNSAIGFVAMSFDAGLRPAWTEGFEPAIRAAGYVPLRIDEEEFLGGITDQIMAEIRRSRFVVADYTGQKNGVYFEAGFALGLPLPVIPTCRADEIEKLHFDIKHLNTLVWKTPEELNDLLAKRIRAIIGPGP